MVFSLPINENIIEMEYAVRGPIPQRAAQLKAAGRKTIPCNIGNPQALGQKPISFYRQVLSLVEDQRSIARERKILELTTRNSDFASAFSDDELYSPEILDMAEYIVMNMETGTGAYTESKGPLFIRQAVARYIDSRDRIEENDGVCSDPDTLFLTNGASEGVRFILEMLIGSENDGIMIPIPQYPLYSAAIRKCGGVQINYYPDEDRDWALDRQILEDAYSRARNAGVTPKAIVVINPGNPTGAILDEASVEEVIDFARTYQLPIIADEVYQENLYGAEFFSFARKIGREEIPLFSLHSISKGFYGECGHRGGYLEVRNPPELENSNLSFIDVLVKQASVNLCSNTIGQILTYLMVTPPKEGTKTHVQFMKEKRQVLDDLYGKAVMIKEAFTKMDGVQCFGRIGAMYLFPRLNILPPGTTDFDYCMALLEETGITTVNGSGFGQKAGTHHLRIAFLPSRALLSEVLPQWIEFHNRYVHS